MKYFPAIRCILMMLSLNLIVDGAPSFNYNHQDLEDHQSTPTVSTTSRSSKRVTIQSVLGRTRGKAGDLDPQTQNDMRILSLFEHELNKIFSCYVRLSCPRTRNPEVIAECEELRNWPLYHQVMRMAGIKRYPYQNYAPQSSPFSVPNTSSTRNHLPAEVDEDTVRTRRHHRGNRQRRTDSQAPQPQ